MRREIRPRKPCREEQGGYESTPIDRFVTGCFLPALVILFGAGAVLGILGAIGAFGAACIVAIFHG